MTLAEKILWEEIRKKKILWKTFYKQKSIYVYTENNFLNRYIIPDFVCLTEKIIIEIDWNIHDKKEIYELDKHKEILLKNLWYKILRFRNDEVLNNIQGVLEKLVASFLYVKERIQDRNS
jgi:very-short-patch-repair endonuclease